MCHEIELSTFKEHNVKIKFDEDDLKLEIYFRL